MGVYYVKGWKAESDSQNPKIEAFFKLISLAKF